MSGPALSRIVLRTSNLEASLAFYRSLGFTFLEEKHGTGPIHYATQIGASVMEIFPGEAAPPLARKAGGATMLGFAVASVDEAVAAVRRLRAQILTEPSDSPWGRRAVVLDPDGRSVELSTPKATDS